METRVCRLHGPATCARDPAARSPGPGEVLVALGAGGICGSDLHYWQDGGFGPIRVREPIILGHEAAGTVIALGPGVAGLAPGDRVALNPSQPCGTCRFCAEGPRSTASRCASRARRCGSPTNRACSAPHGGCGGAVPQGRARHPHRAAACAEPLAVCLHARRRAERLGPRRAPGSRHRRGSDRRALRRAGGRQPARPRWS
jgi:L-idonate 5-dehydrogenase